MRSAKRILKLCEANKGFYVKAGQFVAALRQVPNEYISILSSLQDQVFVILFTYLNFSLFQSILHGLTCFHPIMFYANLLVANTLGSSLQFQRYKGSTNWQSWSGFI